MNPLPLSPKDVSPIEVEIDLVPLVEASDPGVRADPEPLDTRGVTAPSAGPAQGLGSGWADRLPARPSRLPGPRGEER